MRIKLKKGKQKKLILLVKKDSSWSKMSKLLHLSISYLSKDLANEKRLLSENVYKKLCDLAGTNFDEFILKRLDDNWGRSKGGKQSKKNIKSFVEPEKSKELAEVFGIILGDGHLSDYVRGKKIRVYCIRIAGNSYSDEEYIKKYIPSLFSTVFGECGSIIQSKVCDCAYFTIYGKRLVEFLKANGLKAGNKVKNNVGIPSWIKENPSFLKSCLKGLIDTDGSVHQISKTNKNLRIDFTNHSKKLLEDAHSSFIKLGFNPSKIIDDRHFFLSKFKEIERYILEIGFSNSKNLKRAKLFLSKKKAPLV